ncbi:homoserine dehydrogenase [Niallia circulans]|uniref:homoserine dehydrogenase n=1 Tax=Niallia circulans TaxID=1397 RepID=UPI0026F31237|nr:homoserine dehydrogenase [Niallia circulans]
MAKKGISETMKQKKIIITGYGTVGKEFIELLYRKKEVYIKQYQTELIVTGVVGSVGMIYEPQGLDLSILNQLPTGSIGISQYASMKDLVLESPVIQGDILVECTPTNLETGEPALSYIKKALEAKMDIVSISKGALVHSLPELLAIAKGKGCHIKYSGATAAALPTLDIGEFSLAGSTIQSIKGILNGTSNFILTSMSEGNLTFEKALQLAQENGIAEKNPDLDIKGLDSACKILLLANGLLHTNLTLEDVDIDGIDKITKADIQRAKINSCEWKLIATAKKQRDKFILQVKPEMIPPENPLIHVKGTNKGILFETEEMGAICCVGGASHPRGAAAAAMKDMINLIRQE